MNQLKTPRAFVRRFDAVRARMLQVQMARAAIRSLLIVMSGVALLAGADFLWEMPLWVRGIGLFGTLTAVAGLAAYWIVTAVRHSNRPRTAYEIEEHFPELGQSVRTAVQFGGRADDAVAAEGVRSTLVDALEERIDAETQPLPIESIIPTRRLKIVLAMVVAVCVVLGGLFIADSEWNTAGKRAALLAELPYTQLSVTPGSAQIEQGKDFTIGVELSGRTKRNVTLWLRNSDEPDAQWREQVLSDEDRIVSEQGLARYEVSLPKIKEPFEYRVAAGKLASDAYEVTLRYPLHLDKIEVELTPPEYTRAETATVNDGNVQALEGTRALFRFELDRAPVRAQVVLADPADRLARFNDKDTQTPET